LCVCVEKCIASHIEKSDANKFPLKYKTQLNDASKVSEICF